MIRNQSKSGVNETFFLVPGVRVDGVGFKVLRLCFLKRCVFCFVREELEGVSLADFIMPVRGF
jgi:hypothetical protein